MHTVIILVFLFLALYFLYESGVIAFQSKRAMLFAASINGMKAKFGSCTGKITRIVRFKEKREYTVRFERSAEKGAVLLALTDREGHTLIESGEEESYTLSPEPGKRYKLCIRMEKASGSYKIVIL